MAGSSGGHATALIAGAAIAASPKNVTPCSDNPEKRPSSRIPCFQIHRSTHRKPSVMGAVLSLRPDPPRLRLRLERPPNSTEPTPCLRGASEDQKMESFFGYEPARVASALKTCKTLGQKRMGFQTRRERRHFHRHRRSFELITEKVCKARRPKHQSG